LVDQLAGRTHEVRLPRKRARFLFVQERHVDAPQDLEHAVGLSRDPIVHRVRQSEPRPLHLLEHFELEIRVDVREEHIGAFAMM
jgi:hypothetical protein